MVKLWSNVKPRATFDVTARSKVFLFALTGYIDILNLSEADQSVSLL